MLNRKYGMQSSNFLMLAFMGSHKTVFLRKMVHNRPETSVSLHPEAMPRALIIAEFVTLLSSAALLGQIAVAEGKNPLKYEDEQVAMRLVIRTPEQLSAFYQGREFNRAAIDHILDTCFITPIIRNKTFEVLWLELDQWRFETRTQAISRIKRDYWPQKWHEADLPQAQQSTFGWTLMPEVRDLRLDESVGGSVVIPMQSIPFTLTANFPTGMDKQGDMKSIVFEGIQCATDTP